MNKTAAQLLKKTAQEVAKMYSNPERSQNFNKETFEVDEITPLSENTAAIYYKKNTGKRVAFFFYYLAKGSYRRWNYFVPTDGHILGMNQFGRYKALCEGYNFEFNFFEEGED